MTTKHLFKVITDDDWEVSLKRARGLTNSISEQIHMKLHPCNPTPGIETKTSMITFNQVPLLNVIVCRCGGTCIGTIDKFLDEWRFVPNIEVLSSIQLKEIVFKLETLNEPHQQQLLKEAIESIDYPPFTD